MILKELFCSECSRFTEGYVEMDDSCVEGHCLTCKTVTTHYVRCSGGTKSRWRYYDWDGYNPRGCIETLSTEVTQETGNGHEPLPHKYSGTVNEWHKRNAEEREDKYRFKRKKEKGRTPIWFDSKEKK